MDIEEAELRAERKLEMENRIYYGEEGEGEGGEDQRDLVDFDLGGDSGRESFSFGLQQQY